MRPQTEVESRKVECEVITDYCSTSNESRRGLKCVESCLFRLNDLDLVMSVSAIDSASNTSFNKMTPIFHNV